jgi:hypothetical protein
MSFGDVTIPPATYALTCTMTKKLLFVTTVLCVVALVAFAADVSGKWSYSMPGFNGGPDRPVTITLKMDGDNLTGSVSGMMGGRGGGGGGGAAPADTPIANAKVSGDNVTFEVHRQGRNGETVTKYDGTVSGDTMKLKVTAPGRGGGDPTTTEYSATRSKT